MNVGSYQTISLIDAEQLKGKILQMPGGDTNPFYLVEILEEYGTSKHSNVGCKVIVPRDKVFKYSKKNEAEISESQVIFDDCDIIAQYKDRDDKRVFLTDYNRQMNELVGQDDAKENAKVKTSDMGALNNDITKAIEKSGKQQNRN